MSETNDPRLGRGRSGFKLPFREIIKILMMMTAIFALIALRGPCAQGVANLFDVFAPPVGDGGAAPPSHDLELTPEQVERMLRDAGPLVIPATAPAR